MEEPQGLDGCCFAISNDFLKELAESPDTPEEAREGLRRTVEHGNEIRKNRNGMARRRLAFINKNRRNKDGVDENGMPLRSGDTAVPLDILQSIVDDEDAPEHRRNAARRTLERRAAREAKKAARQERAEAREEKKAAREEKAAASTGQTEVAGSAATEASGVEGEIPPGEARDATDPRVLEIFARIRKKQLEAAALVDDPVDLDPEDDATESEPGASGSDSKEHVVYAAVSGYTRGMSGIDRHYPLEETGRLLKRRIINANHVKTTAGAVARAEGQEPVSDATANGVYDKIGLFFDFIDKVYGGRLYNEKGQIVVAVIHYGDGYGNSVFDGRQVLLGDGGYGFRSFADSYDFVAHEITHGIVDFNGRFSYAGQCGALHEHIADVFGVMFNQYRLDQDVTQADWYIGKGVSTAVTSGIRSFRNPQASYPRQPGHMNQYDGTEQVHLNSGIPNHAFYLMAAGIGGKIWLTLGRVWWLIMHDPDLDTNCDFEMFASASIAYVEVMYDESILNIVMKAWDDVGVKYNFDFPMY